jgi:ABC-type sugar transport system permease subunit
LIYQRAFEGFSLGQASSIAVMLAVFLGMFSAAYILFVPAGDTEQEVF